MDETRKGVFTRAHALPFPEHDARRSGFRLNKLLLSGAGSDCLNAGNSAPTFMLFSNRWASEDEHHAAMK
jgi:hypothetical protein